MAAPAKSAAKTAAKPGSNGTPEARVPPAAKQEKPADKPSANAGAATAKPTATLKSAANGGAATAEPPRALPKRLPPGISWSDAMRAGLSVGVPRLKVPALLPARQVKTLEDLLRRDEADVILLVGNLALVALEIIEWPVAALTLAVHFLAKTRLKGLEALAEVVEEVE